MKRRILFTLTLALAVSALAADNEGAPGKELAKVLIMGDSISIGYTPYVVEKLKGVAEVKRHRGNAGPTIRGLVQVEEWLGKEKWDLIHFNWGLWDMYGWEPHKEIYWHFSRANAVRQGDLKVVRAGKAWELYDLKADPTETNNLAKERPEKTAELSKMWEAWRQDYKNKPK